MDGSWLMEMKEVGKGKLLGIKWFEGHDFGQVKQSMLFLLQIYLSIIKSKSKEWQGLEDQSTIICMHGIKLCWL